MYDLSEQKGFTLIELLIVISIISILSIMSVGAYIGQKEASLLKLGTSTVFADVLSIRDSMGHGNYDNSNRATSIKNYLNGDNDGVISDDSVAKCSGFEFTLDGVRDFTVEYNGKKVWNAVLNRFEFVGCDDLSERKYGNYILNENVKISSIIRNSNKIDKFIVVFKPPFGDVGYDFESNASNVFTSDGEKIPVLDFATDEVDADKGVDGSKNISKIPKIEFESDVIEKAKVFKEKSEVYTKLRDENLLSGLKSLSADDEVVIKFIYGKMNLDSKGRYIKFDIINDEFSME